MKNIVRNITKTREEKILEKLDGIALAIWYETAENKDLRKVMRELFKLTKGSETTALKKFEEELLKTKEALSPETAPRLKKAFEKTVIEMGF